MVKCARLNKCGYEEHVKEICEDLFKDWSKDFPRTKENPNAAADAYLLHARGFDPNMLRGLYTQELFRNDLKYPNEVTATIRFKLANGIVILSRTAVGIGLSFYEALHAFAASGSGRRF